MLRETSVHISARDHRRHFLPWRNAELGARRASHLDQLDYTWQVHTPRFRSQQLWPAAVFSVTVVGLMVATVVVVDRVPRLRAAATRMAAAEAPTDGDHYLASDSGTTLDHHVLYFDLDDDATARLRAADVLFLGNSRLMFALRPRALEPTFAALGQTWYAMGFGYREMDRFPLALIRRLDLRPRVVVVNSDGFFAGALSAYSETVIRDTRFAARKLRVEGEAAHAVRRVIHAVAPNWLSLLGRPGLGLSGGFNTYRSRIDGTWDISPWPTAAETFTPTPVDGREPGRGEVVAARSFKAELDARGARLILTRVPTPQPLDGASPAAFARLLDVPLVMVTPPGLTSADHSHLDEPSAHDWSRAFMAELAPHLALPPGPPDRPGTTQ